ncbi:MAG: UDP-N-acetylmuramate dehydrogenase [Actinomycetota bacterium]
MDSLRSEGVDRASALLSRKFGGELGGRVFFDRLLGPLTSLRVGGPAAILVEAASEQDLETTGLTAARFEVPILVIGRGSNILVADSGYPGIVIRMAQGFDWIRSGEPPETVVAGGSASLPQVANFAAKRYLAGMEFAVAIPATVGGGVAMNAGAHGSSVSDVLVSVRICRLPEGRTDEVAATDLAMRYRRTELPAGGVVCSATFTLEQADPEVIEGRMKRYRKHRSNTQPSEAPNAGSMFKNPPGETAGRLIEEAGLKGARAGQAEVSTKHGNFFLAHPGATAQDLYNLMALVQSTVFRMFGVTLLPEVKLVGKFDITAGLATVAPEVAS